MAEFLPLPSLEPPKALPPIPDASQDPSPEPADGAALAEGETSVVDSLHDAHKVPLLSLHADGRSPQELAELLEVTTGSLRCPRVPLPKPLEGEGADEPKDLLRLDLDEKQASRRWSPWKQHCPVALYDKTLLPGNKDFSADYVGYAFCFSSTAAQRRFCAWPKLFLTDAPRIDAPGMHLGYVLLSPMGYRCTELAALMAARYSMDVVDIGALTKQALENPTIDKEDTPEPAETPAPAEGAEGEEDAPPPEPASPVAEPTGPRLYIAEKNALLAGTPLSTDTLVRIVAEVLGVDRNIAILQKHRDDVVEAKRVLEELAAKEAEGGGEEPAEGDEEKKPPYELDENGEPVIPLSEPLRVPRRGFVMAGFPETPEQLEALKSNLSLDLERFLWVKPMAEEPQEPADLLVEKGFLPPLPEPVEGEEPAEPAEGEEPKKTPAEERAEAFATQAANFEALSGVEGLQFSDVPMEAEEQEQFLQIQKAIDPFCPRVDDETVADAIPDPDEWEEPAPEEPEEGEPPPDPLEKPTRPVIPWGVCGRYCPVTLTEDEWLFPGQKAYQHMYNNKVYAVASEQAAAKFLAEPGKYVPSEREPMVPQARILVTGPTGSKVDRQCELLSEAYGSIPIVKVETEWKARVEERLEIAREKVRKAKAAEKLQELLEELKGLAPQVKELVDAESFNEAHELKAKEKEIRAKLDKIPSLDLEDANAQFDKIVAEEPMLGEEGITWPEGWTPPEREQAEEEAPAEEEAEEEGEKEPDEDGLDDEGREALYIDAMRDVLGKHCGQCILDGTFFGDLANEELDDGAKEVRSLQQLLIKSQRIPDVVLILKCKNDLAAANALNFEEIDRDYEERKAAYEKLVAEAEEKEEDPPEPPEGLVLDGDEDEKESDRAKSKFLETKAAEQAALKDFADALKEARATVCKVSADRGEAPAQKALRWHCRPYMEQRASIFIVHQIEKIAPSKSVDLTQRAMVLPSRFGEAPPLFTDAPLFAGRPDTLKYPTEFRRRLYYPRGQAEQEQLMERPMDFIHQPFPSRVAVTPAVTITGPPLAGKTYVAKALAERTGAVYVSLPEVIDKLCSRESMQCRLSRGIAEHLKKGQGVPDDLLTEALRHRLRAADVLSRGWVLDDFPLTESQAKALTAAGVVPHRVLIINAPEGLVFTRGRELAAASKEADADLVQQDCALQRQRLQAFWKHSPLLRAYYSFTFDSVRDIDGERSAWSISDHALEETSTAISQRLEYYRKTAADMAARIYGMGFTPQRLQAAESDFKKYCPVTLTLSSELVPCSDTRCIVEYKSKVYWLASDTNANLFLEDPEAYLQVPLPQALPRLLTPLERRTVAAQAELEGHCPVALVDGQELVKASGNHAAHYQHRYWMFENKEASEKFMRRPARYTAKVKMPNKRPEKQGEDTITLLKCLGEGRINGMPLEHDDMLTYMQASVSELICQAMVESGARRPLYPGKSPQESALLFLSRYLKAKNSVATELYAIDVRKKYQDFLYDCSVPEKMKGLREQEKAGAQSWTAWDKKQYKELQAHFDDLFENVDPSSAR